MGKIYKNGIEYGGGGGDSVGHIILDNDGTAMAEEPNLQFKGLNVTDNSTDEITEVESVGLNQDSMDDVLNASISGNQVASNGLVYSTEEQVVGKWVDGKPLYQKTLTGSTSIAGNAWSDTGIITPSNITLVDLLPIQYPDGSQCQIIPCIGYIENNHLQIFNIRNNTYAVAPIYATIRYTKTTD